MSFGQPFPTPPSQGIPVSPDSLGQASEHNQKPRFVPSAAFSFGPSTPFGTSYLPVWAESTPAPAESIRTPKAKSTSAEQGKCTGIVASSDFAQLLTDEIMIVYFPCNKRQYTLHKSVLSSKSMYFKSMLSSTMQEATAGRLVLDWNESCEIAFRSIIQYLYTGDYNINQFGTVHTLGRVKSSETGLFTQRFVGDMRLNTDADHVHIYVVADRLMIPELKSLALARFMAPDSGNRVMHVYPEYIKPLVDILYYDAVDVPGEQGQLDGKVAQPLSPSAPPEVSGFSDPRTTTEVISSDIDPRQSMQKEFVKKVLMGIKMSEVSAICGELMLEGGQFSQDVFQSMSNSNADPSSRRLFG